MDPYASRDVYNTGYNTSPVPVMDPYASYVPTPNNTNAPVSTPSNPSFNLDPYASLTPFQFPAVGDNSPYNSASDYDQHSAAQKSTTRRSW